MRSCGRSLRFGRSSLCRHGFDGFLRVFFVLLGSVGCFFVGRGLHLLSRLVLGLLSLKLKLLDLCLRFLLDLRHLLFLFFGGLLDLLRLDAFGFRSLFFDFSFGLLRRSLCLGLGGLDLLLRSLLPLLGLLRDDCLLGGQLDLFLLRLRLGRLLGLLHLELGLARVFSDLGGGDLRALLDFLLLKQFLDLLRVFCLCFLHLLLQLPHCSNLVVICLLHLVH